MKGFKLVYALLVMVLSISVLSWPAVAQGPATVGLQVLHTPVQVGDTINVDIRIGNVSDLYAAEVHLTFDTALLQVLDDDDAQAGVQILPGSLFPSTRPSYVAQNRADQTAGTADFAMTMLDPATPVSGAGTLATVRFSAKQAGTAILQWTMVKLANQAGMSIAHTAQDCQILISPPSTVAPKPSPANCTDLIDNGGFEQTRTWRMPVTPHKADYSTADRYAGARSVRLGIEPGAPDVYSHSSAYQHIHVPANATSVTLTFWARRFTQETVKAQADAVDVYDPAQVIQETMDWTLKSDRAQEDWQEVLILQDGCYNWLATLLRGRSNDGAWVQYSYDVSAFAGQNIVVYFNVINNGVGERRTWMYVDEVRVDACYGTTPCAEQVKNKSFEWTGAWTLANTPRPANYTTDAAYDGVRAMRLGVTPSTWDAYSHSSAYQRISIPAGATSPTLSFWYKAYTEDTVRTTWKAEDGLGYEPAEVISGKEMERKCCGEVDWQEMLLLDTSYRLLSGGVVLRQNRNDGAWTRVTYDLSPYKGTDIVLYFNVINDGNGKRTWMYVDDVSVNLCGQQVRFDPPATTTTVGNTFVVNVRAEQVGNLYGIDATVRFDPALLEVTSVAAGNWWSSLNPYIVATNIENVSGGVRYAASLTSPTPALNGSGNLIAITFKAKTQGSTPLWFSALKLVDAGAQVIPAGHADGQVTVSSAQTAATLTGLVQLEGRTSYSGVVVQIDGGATVTTTADGRYTFATAAGQHTLTFARPSYLGRSMTAQGTAGSTVTLPTVTLLGGNVNGDNCIDILDLAAVASQFNSTTPTPATTDINGDGLVDIVDVVLVAKNFGTCK
ncbi:MAG: immune inhibitor A [Anaerolineae bacterium]|nr:immune inhibitor A [Anaerolineae bacterium]